MYRAGSEMSCTTFGATEHRLWTCSAADPANESSPDANDTIGSMEWNLECAATVPFSVPTAEPRQSRNVTVRRAQNVALIRSTLKLS
jgi:hypothetical protein